VKTRVIWVLLAAGTVWGGAALAQSAAAWPPVFPEIEGFSLSGEPRSYDPGTLFEYIDGKADGYLDYAFQELSGRDYLADGGGTISVDVYRHATVNDAYGIMSSERPGDAVEAGVGAAGYAEPGHLNFFKNVYYVKIAGQDLGEAEAAVLARAAARMAGALPGEAAIPSAVACFPSPGLIPNSVRYVSQGFLGHGFLHSAFVAEYESDAGPFRAFILEGADDADIEAMRDGYLALVRKKGGDITSDGRTHRFHDPYRKSEGRLSLTRAGLRLLGVFDDDPVAADNLMDAIERNLTPPGK
jgi:hypothetical protein